MAKASSTRGWVSDALALACALITALAITRGLLYYLPEVQEALIVGATAGLLAKTRVSAAIVGAAACVVSGLLLAPIQLAEARVGTLALTLVGIAAGAAVVAVGVRWLDEARRRPRVWASLALVVLIALNLAVTTMKLDTTTFESSGLTPAQLIMQVPKAGTVMDDPTFYQRVLALMQGGKGYYAAFRQAYHDNARWGTDPSSVLSYRLPTFFWFWLAVPAKPWGIFAAWLVLATGALAAATWLAYLRVPMPFAVPAAGALASYLLYLGSTNAILATETWAAPLGVVAVALAVASYHRQRWVALSVAAVAVALLAALVRELMVYLLVAGIASAAFARREERVVRVVTWGSGIAVFAALYVVHAERVKGMLSHLQQASVFFQGGLHFLFETFSWASGYLGGVWLPTVLAVLAVIGAAFAPSRAEKVLLLVATISPLVVFLILGNGATSDAGAPVNYWAPIVVPVLIALSPWAVAAVPGVVLPPEGHAATASRRSRSA